MNMPMVLSAVLQGMAVLLQLITAFLALRLIRITGWKTAWLLIAGAICIMALRRGYSLWHWLAVSASSPNSVDVAMALAISLLMLLGMVTITPLFQPIKNSGQNLPKNPEVLASQVVASIAPPWSPKEQPEGGIRERQQAENPGEFDHQRLYALLEALPALIYLKGPDYTIRFANRRFREDFGDPEGRHCYDIFGSNRVCPRCVSLKVLETGKPIREEWVRPYGERIYEFIHYPFSDIDNSPLVLTMGIDITARKRMEETLRQSEEKFRLLVNQIPAVVFKGYADWSVDFFDNKIETLTGYTKEDFDLRRLKWCDVIPPEDLDHAKAIFLDALKSGGSYVREHRIIRKDGEIRWVQCWGQIFRSSRGKIEYISGVTFDITPRKQMEEALRQSEASLHHLTSQLLTVQEKERARIARELHDELGQSLMVMKMKMGAIQRLARTRKQTIRDGFKEILDGLDEMVENVRRISWDLCPYFLADLGLEVALQRLFREFSKHSRITLELDGDLAGLNHAIPAANQIHIYRIFQECLTNIGRHSGASALRLAVSLNDKEVSFSLEDNGRGFDLEAVRESATSSEGIGLATLKERARLLGGEMSISSEPGKGTSINLVLPVKPEN